MGTHGYSLWALYMGKVVIGFRLDSHPDVIRSLSNPSWENMRVFAADVPVRWLYSGHRCVYVTVGTHTAMKELVLMTTLPLYSNHA